MYKRIWSFSFALSVFWCVSGMSVWASVVPCVPYNSFVGALSAEGQVFQYTRKDDRGDVFDYFESPDGAWTLVMPVEGNMACIVGSGEAAPVSDFWGV